MFTGCAKSGKGKSGGGEIAQTVATLPSSCGACSSDAKNTNNEDLLRSCIQTMTCTGGGTGQSGGNRFGSSRFGIERFAP